MFGNIHHREFRNIQQAGALKIMQNLNIRKAEKSDMGLLIKLRLDFLNEGYNGAITPDEGNTVITQLNEYFQKHLETGDFIAVLAETDGKIALNLKILEFKLFLSLVIIICRFL